MLFGEEKRRIKAAILQKRVRCLDCDCIGVLRQKGKKVYLLPEKILTTRSIRTQEYHVRKLKKKKTWKKKVTAKTSFAKHGFSTMPQMGSYLTIGSIFWILVMLMTNLYSLEKSRAVTTYLTSTCNRNYKECVRLAEMDICGHLMKQCFETQEFLLPEPVSQIENVKATPLDFFEEENKVNLRRCQKKQFYDQKICRHLCSETLVLRSTRTNPISPCESMCFQLTRASDSAGKVCPFEEYCPKGCPCQFYKCEKFESRQKLIPVFDLRNKSRNVDISNSTITGSNGDIQLITDRLKDRKSFEKEKFPVLFADSNGNSQRLNGSDSLLSYSIGATFLSGEHYLVDALGNLLRVKEAGIDSIFISNRRENIGFFVFHFGSSIGTHQIEIRHRENESKMFPVVVICRPTSRDEKCFYYAPDYNLQRFEEAQGYIASNHFNAKVSSASFKGVFFLMSVRMGDFYIKLSTTKALNRIRNDEELEKGWKKGEIQMPRELRDLDPVHVLPLTDLGRLILIIVTRSIKLSNTLFSVLLEAEGKFLTLGREWIGSLVDYEGIPKDSVCYSRMFADDPYYTDKEGKNKDECEYFGNGIVNDERIFVQNYVFDVSFEIKFIFELIEIEFVQKETNKQMHVTSNPNFAFHDDIFPSFAKNAVAQQKFPQPSPYFKTIIPDQFFTSLAELNHISTLEMKLNEPEYFQFEVFFSEKSRIFEEMKILELSFFDGSTLLSFGVSSNYSLWIDSDYFEIRSFLETKITQLSKFELRFQSSSLTETSLQIIKNQKKKRELSRIKMSGLENLKTKKLRIFKFDDRAEIKNFYLSYEKAILVMGEDLKDAFSISLDGKTRNKAAIVAPSNDYLEDAPHALVKNALFIIGGYTDRQKIAKLEGCTWTEQQTRLINEFSYGSAALSLDEGTKALICFDWYDGNRCEVFDGQDSTEIFNSKYRHWGGGLCFYQGKPTTVGSSYGDGMDKVETLGSLGWTSLPDFPKEY